MKGSVAEVSLRYLLCAVVFSLFLMRFAEARVAGTCSDCHTMHNSQSGQTVAVSGTQPCLLNKSGCLGCHGQIPGGSQNIIPVGNVPQVLHSGGTDLGGGNFAYITGAKARGTGADSNTTGHNIVDIGVNETVLTSPPGDEHNTGINNGNFTCAGAKGCHGDRNIDGGMLALKGAHHADDSILRFGSIDESRQGNESGTSYRFLKGVKGGEDTDWQATYGSTDHNEYKGSATMGASSATSPADNTISGLCAECHGYYHGTTSSEAGSSSPWLRHPTDTSLPAGGEYSSYTTYSLIAPVGRTAIPQSPGNAVTPPGNTDDIVMCLSCHRAHASPNYKMMRWDYKGWPGAGTNGCNVCHTGKN